MVTIWRYISWLGLSLLAAALVGVCSWLVQRQGFAPIGLLSIAVGIAVGGVAATLARLLPCGRGRALLVGGLLVGLTAAGAQHLTAYCQYQADAAARAAQNPKAEVARAVFSEIYPEEPPGFWRETYSARSLIYWMLDAGLIVLAAVLVLRYSLLGEYCEQCQRWARTLRIAKLTPSQTAALATQLPHLLPTSWQQNSPRTAVRLELVGCLAGCTPVKLVIKQGGTRESAWLDGAEAQALRSALDGFSSS